jgi:hypothetical protein
MTRNPDLVGGLPFPALKVEKALSSIDEAVRALRAASGRPRFRPRVSPSPTACLTKAPQARATLPDLVGCGLPSRRCVWEGR